MRQKFVRFIQDVYDHEGFPPEPCDAGESDELQFGFDIDDLRFDITHDPEVSDLVEIRAVVCPLPQQTDQLETLMCAALMSTHRASRLNGGMFAIRLETRELHYRTKYPAQSLDAQALLPALHELAGALREWRDESAFRRFS
ncbi:hypothetical protein [Variovorax sp. KK3]|uniref:hypothetical protein n=1 Tax=Variovorax sp. KK3 TaxID=1855728 RepID=UPI00097C7C7E|nr:hypothetical protein [Variovorax sp. KK3]